MKSNIKKIILNSDAPWFKKEYKTFCSQLLSKN